MTVEFEPIADHAHLESQPMPNGQIGHTITGTLPQVLREIETMFYEFPPAGYGTSCTHITQKGYGNTFMARIVRSKSCS
jgi:hypothetical protein